MVFSCFSKILEKLYIYLSENKILFRQQFFWGAGHSTNNTIFQLLDEITIVSRKIRRIIYLLKAFEAVDQKILSEKLEMCCVKDGNLQWF